MLEGPLISLVALLGLALWWLCLQHQHCLASCLRLLRSLQPYARPQSRVLHVADGQWHHVAFTWESSSGETLLYLDGKLVRLPQRKQPALCDLHMCS